MHYLLDGLVIVVLLIYTVSCAKKGFVECLFGLISTIAAFALAFLFSNTLLEATNGFFGVAKKAGVMLASALSWVTIFLVVKLIVRLVKKVVTAIVDKIPLVGSLNHILGLIVGLAEGLLIVWVVFAVLAFASTSAPDAVQKILEPMQETFLAKELYYNNPVGGWLYEITRDYAIAQ